MRVLLSSYGIGHGGPNGASPFENSAFFKAGMHGVTSGMRSVLEGGEFHHGLISGLAGHFSGELTGDIGGSTFYVVMGRTMVAAFFGGLSSWAAGGDFVQGAMIAATVHLFNEEWGNRKNISSEFMRNVNEITPGGAWANWGWHNYRDNNAY